MKRPVPGHRGVSGLKSDDGLPAVHSFADLSVVREGRVR